MRTNNVRPHLIENEKSSATIRIVLLVHPDRESKRFSAYSAFLSRAQTENRYVFENGIYIFRVCGYMRGKYKKNLFKDM